MANPSNVPTDAKVEVGLTYKFSTGPIKDLSTLAFSGAKIWGQENTSTHVGRVSAFNEQEGPYINYPKAYLNYAYRLRIAENTSLSAGTALGGAGIYFSAPSATTSLFLPDGSLGLGLQHRKVSLGASSMQMFNSTVAPLLATIRFTRYYQLHAEAEKELGIDWLFKASVLWRILPKVKDDFIGSLSFEYLETLRFGAAYRKNAGLALFGAVYLHGESNNVMISFTYNSPFFSNLPRLQNSMEIGLAYVMK